MRKLLLLSALCLGASAAGRADTVFSLVNNTYDGGGLATGSVTIDTVGGTFTSVNISLLLGGNDYVFTGAPDTQSTFDNNSQYFEFSFDSNGNALTVDIPGASLVGYTGGKLCTNTNLCGTASEQANNQGYEGNLQLVDGTQYGALTGSLTTTPEPSSMILLGTGLLATANTVRRRLFSRGA